MTKMESIDVPRVLSILGAVAEAATTDELLGAVLEASVALVHPDTAVVTEVGAVDIQDSAVVTRDSAVVTRDGAVVTKDSAHVTKGNTMVTAVSPAGPRIKTWPKDILLQSNGSLHSTN